MRHYLTLEWWSIISLLGGLALPILKTTRVTLYFGLACAVWSGVNLVMIYAARHIDHSPRSPAIFISVLRANQITNYLYVAVGIGMWVIMQDLGWKAAAAALSLQGFVHLVLDGTLLRRVRRALKNSDQSP